METKPLSASDILGTLRENRSARAVEIAPAEQQGFLRAAAVLTAIRNIGALRPDGTVEAVGRGGAARALKDQLMLVSGRRFDGNVMLTPEARREALASFQSTEEIEAALDANREERKSELQQHFESYLLGRAKPLGAQSLAELRRTLQVCVWTEGLIDEVPDADAVRRLIELQQLLAPFEALASDDRFRGRAAEIDILRGFVGVLAPDSLLRRLGSRVHNWVRPPERAAMTLYGPGGVGKSALVARFMLEHTRVRDDMKIPFAYLDFDRPALDVSDPLGLVVDVLRQLSLQFPQGKAYASLYGAAQELTRARSDAKVDRLSSARALFADALGAMESQLGPRPFVFVLDTFEEVQFRGETRATPLWGILIDLQKRWPFLRVVISGRAPATSLMLNGSKPEPLELGGLDEDSAVAILKNDGVGDEDLARRLVRQVGAVPLSLKLVAEMFRRDLIEEGGIKDLKTKSHFWISASAEVIQGQLYDRILGRIHDEQVRRLAHPGLVLRRVTTEVILNVLNEPCALGISGKEEAEELFDKLQQETSLVTLDDSEGALVHRADLRRLMLGLLQQREPARVAQIHRNAVEWYAKPRDLRSRAEWLYHRASLGETISRREVSNPEVRSSLQASISELPAPVQAMLASYGFQVSKDILDSASREQRDANYQAQIEELLPYGASATPQLEAVFDEIVKRLDRATPLFRTAARIFLHKRNQDRAFKYIEEGLYYSVPPGRSLLTLELLSEKAWALRGKTAELATVLDALLDYAQREASPLFMLQERLQRLELRGNGGATSGSGPLEEIPKLLDQLSSSQLWDIVPALERAAAPLAKTRPESMTRIARLVVADESAFTSARFADPSANSALSMLIDAAYSAQEKPPKEGATRVAVNLVALCKAWPYPMLQVRPPYGRGRESLTEARA